MSVQVIIVGIEGCDLDQKKKEGASILTSLEFNGAFQLLLKQIEGPKLYSFA